MIFLELLTQIFSIPSGIISEQDPGVEACLVKKADDMSKILQSHRQNPRLEITKLYFLELSSGSQPILIAILLEVPPSNSTQEIQLQIFYHAPHTPLHSVEQALTALLNLPKNFPLPSQEPLPSDFSRLPTTVNSFLEARPRFDPEKDMWEQLNDLKILTGNRSSDLVDFLNARLVRLYLTTRLTAFAAELANLPWQNLHSENLIRVGKIWTKVKGQQPFEPYLKAITSLFCIPATSLPCGKLFLESFIQHFQLRGQGRLPTISYSNLPLQYSGFWKNFLTKIFTKILTHERIGEISVEFWQKLFSINFDELTLPEGLACGILEIDQSFQNLAIEHRDYETHDQSIKDIIFAKVELVSEPVGNYLLALRKFLTEESAYDPCFPTGYPSQDLEIAKTVMTALSNLKSFPFSEKLQQAEAKLPRTISNPTMVTHAPTPQTNGHVSALLARLHVAGLPGTTFPSEKDPGTAASTSGASNSA